MNNPRKHLVLVGMMGSGKSTVGRRLAERTGLPLADTDAWIEARERQTVSDIFRVLGEETFRQKEKMAVQRLVEESPSVLATGGGLFMDPDNRDVLKERGVVFYLKASAEELAARTQKGVHRPLLQGKDHLAELRDKLAQREKYYELADHVIEAGTRSVEEIAEEILGHWRNES